MGNQTQSENEYERALRIKGYGFKEYEYKSLEEQMQKKS